MGSSADIETLLKMHVVAVVGCSPNPARPSNQVASYLMEIGYKVIPVHPGHQEVLGEKCYPELADVPEPIDVVNVFRRSEFVPDIVRQALAVKAKGLWLQDGIDAPEAVKEARKKGLTVVVNDCIMRQHLSRMGR